MFCILSNRNLPAAIPANIRAAYIVSTFVDAAINIQLIKNGIVVTIAIGLRPNLSINGPMIKEPNGSDIVTSEAESLVSYLFFVHFQVENFYLSMKLHLVLYELNS